MNFQKIDDFRSSLRYRPWGILVGVSVSYPTRTRAVAQLLGESKAYGSVGWHDTFVTGCQWSKYRLGLPRSQWIVVSRARWEFPLFFKDHSQSPCIAPTPGPQRHTNACLCPSGLLCERTTKQSAGKRKWQASLRHCVAAPIMDRLHADHVSKSRETSPDILWLMLTHYGLVATWGVVRLNHYWFGYWLDNYSAPNHYLKLKQF